MKGRWIYLYHTVDRDGQTLDFMRSERRSLTAARPFFTRAIGLTACWIGSGANLAGLLTVNVTRKFTCVCRTVQIRQFRYLNNILRQEHRFIEPITGPVMGIKAFHSAAVSIAGIRAAHLIPKGQIPAAGATTFQTFAALAA